MIKSMKELVEEKRKQLDEIRRNNMLESVANEVNSLEDFLMDENNNLSDCVIAILKCADNIRKCVKVEVKE